MTEIAWALIQMLDGVARHDLQGQLGLPEIECERIWKAAEDARAVLDRWNRPILKPVPVSEGLPRPEDCDAVGKCWWAANDGIYDHWRKLDLDKALNNPWRPTHWLPHHALPTPNQEAGQ